MNFVKPSVEVVTGASGAKKIEQVARTCYKSESKISEGSAAKFLTNVLLKNNHLAMVEHYRFEVQFDDNLAAITFATQNAKYLELTQNAKIVGNLRAFYEAVKKSPNPIGIINDQVLTICLNIFNDRDPNEGVNTNIVSFVREDPFYATFKAVTDRGVLAEWTRHRVESFGVESTRYCNYGKLGVMFCLADPYLWAPLLIEGVTAARPQWERYTTDILRSQGLEDQEIFDELERLFGIQLTWIEAMENAEKSYNQMLAFGCKPQEARSVLPNSLKTEINATATFKDWEHFISLRNAKDAHPQIKILAAQVQNYLESNETYIQWKHR